MLKPILILVSWLLIPASNSAASANSLAGNWVSVGENETRTLTLATDGKGQFLSMHSLGQCSAALDTVVDQTFVMASGIAPHCQQRNNGVAFEFYCQQLGPDHLRCKIRSSHLKSGNSKQGVETFKRQ